MTTAVMVPDFAALPPCAVNCGALYGANARCVPPAVPESNMATYTSCFCADSEVSSLSTSLTVCSDVCPDAQAMDLLQKWFKGTCSTEDSTGTNSGNSDDSNTNGGTGTTGNDQTGSQGGNTGADGRPTTTGKVVYANNGGSWFSNHWEWIVMLIVLFVAIVGIWVGACIWRRRYLKKKERQRTWNQKQSGSQSRPSWGPGDPRAVEAGKALARPTIGDSQPSDSSAAAGVFMPGAEVTPTEKPAKPSRKFWAR